MPLLGSEDPRQYAAIDAHGKYGDLRNAVVTFFAAENGSFQFVGTGFFVANSLVVTARHVVEELRVDERACPVFQLKANGHASVRSIRGACLSANADLALVQLVMPEGDDNPALILRAEKPAIGSEVLTLACPNTVIAGTPGRQTIHCDYEYFGGKVAEIFPEGRDRVMLPWPCFQLDMHIHPGASGGPVFDRRGCVFAVNCASEEPHTDTSYATSIDMLFGLAVQDVLIKGRHFALAKVEDFVDAGVIAYR